MTDTLNSGVDASLWFGVYELLIAITNNKLLIHIQHMTFDLHHSSCNDLHEVAGAEMVGGVGRGSTCRSWTVSSVTIG